MKTLADLPPELLPNVLRHLPIYSQRQCLAVSRWWNEAVRPWIPTDADKLDLHGYGAIRNLFTEIRANPDYGRRIRRLNFIMQTGTGRPVTRDELVAILEGCPNLAEIDFVDVNPFYYLMYMVEEEIQMPKLEFVRVSDPHHLATLGHRFVDFAFYYRRTLTQLTIDIHSTQFSLDVGVDSILAYFRRFTTLKHLHLVTTCSIVLDELLAACPTLQKLTLDASSANVRAMDPIVGVLAEPIIETIELDQSLITTEMYVYLRDYCTHIRQLSIFGRARNNANDAIIAVLQGFEPDQALRIITISFKNNFDVSPQLLANLHTWFPHVRQVEFKYCGFAAVARDSRNLMLSFADLHIDYLAIDLAPILDRRGSVSKVALEIISGDTTTWYQRDGKVRARHDFSLKNRKSYTKDEAKQKRLESNSIAVITIEAAYVNNIRLHITNRASTLNQLIHLADEEEEDTTTTEFDDSD